MCTEPEKLKRRGKALEELVSKLERVLADKNVRIESPKRLRDKVTKRLRKHDVVLTLNAEHHHLTVAIECRDRSRPVGVEQIEAFHTKCQHTGVDKGVIVSPAGFALTARQKADSFGIRCLDLKVLEEFDWLLGESMEIATMALTGNVAFICIPAHKLERKPVNFEVLDAQGNPISENSLRNNVEAQLHRFGELKPGIHHGGIHLEISGCALRDCETQATYPLVRIDAKFDFTVSKTRLPFKLVSYEDAKEPGNVITQAALVSVTAGPLSGSLVFTHKPGDGTDVKYVLEPVQGQIALQSQGYSRTVFTALPQP